MAKRKYSVNKLSKFAQDQIKVIAQSNNKDVSTDYKLNKYYTTHQQFFDDFYNSDSGGTTIPKSSSQIFSSINTLDKSGYEFYVNGKKVSALDAKYKIALTEQMLNNEFSATGTEFSYRITNDGRILIKLPSQNEVEEFHDESAEIIVDHFTEEYGINIYISDPKTSKQYKENEKYREEYATKSANRLKQLRAERREHKKTKPRRKRRK